jgi:predicted MFS family arabinose efflux permease
MGFLGGAAFAIFYTFMGIPVARLADTSVRRNVVAVSLTVWSAMTFVCGLALNFWHLLAARIGVAIGEAGGSPPSHSMISDLFPPSRRATALAIYALGIPAGGMLGSLLGGWLNEAFDWRTAFMVVGLPGILLAVVVRLTLREPIRGATEPLPVVDEPPPPVAEVFRHLWSRRSFRYLALGAGLQSFVGYGVGYWIPAFLMRTHEMGTGLIGTWLFWLGVPGMIGTFLGGWLGDRMSHRDVRWYVWLPGIANLIGLPFGVFFYLWHDPVVALAVSAIPAVLGGYYLGPTFALTQAMSTLRMRAMAASIILFFINLIGMGLGPQVTGLASDLLATHAGLGGESLRWALVGVLMVNVVASVCYFLASRDLRADLARTAG